MHIHFLGICGTFMGSLALLARDLGHTVTGSDSDIYPPMSTQLQNAGITIMQGYQATHLQPAPDLVVVGNVMKRGVEAIEYMLQARLNYTSAPQFLSEQLLWRRHVLAVAGTHGKTTTTTMLAWILQYAGIDTGFLIGGVPLIDTKDVRLQQIFKHSSHLGQDKSNHQEAYFVIEADEYDSAFFDKRSKFIHYRPKTVILNNLEFDHADIFANLEAIQAQFHHMIRTIASDGKIIMPADCQSLEETIAKGCWTPIWRTAVHLDDKQNNENGDWQAYLIKEDGSSFVVHHQGQQAVVDWRMNGLHSVHNGLSAISAAVNVGISLTKACEALCCFAGVKRRMELIDRIGEIEVYDDFAHHPTAIAMTLDGARKKLGQRKIWAIIEPRSNTMKLGVYQKQLALSANIADAVIWYETPQLDWSVKQAIGSAPNQLVYDDIQAIITHICDHVGRDDVLIVMSNGSFDGIHGRLVEALRKMNVE